MTGGDGGGGETVGATEPAGGTDPDLISNRATDRRFLRRSVPMSRVRSFSRAFRLHPCHGSNPSPPHPSASHTRSAGLSRARHSIAPALTRAGPFPTSERRPRPRSHERIRSPPRPRGSPPLADRGWLHLRSLSREGRLSTRLLARPTVSPSHQRVLACRDCAVGSQFLRTKHPVHSLSRRTAHILRNCKPK